MYLLKSEENRLHARIEIWNDMYLYNVWNPVKKINDSIFYFDTELTWELTKKCINLN